MVMTGFRLLQSK